MELENGLENVHNKCLNWVKNTTLATWEHTFNELNNFHDSIFMD